MDPTAAGLAQDKPADRTAGLIDWAVAERVARWTAARSSAPSLRPGSEADQQFQALTTQAEDLVEAATGLRSPTPARARVTDRNGWVRANVASIQRLLGPTLAKLEDKKNRAPANAVPAVLSALPRPFAGASRSLSGAQLGLVLGWMSTRVLGQYDLLLTEDGGDDQDIVYYVGPNIEALETRYGFSPGQFRLWLALHEVTHRCQFTAVPWLRDHFLSLVDEGLDPEAVDPRRLAEALKRAADEVRAGRSPLTDAGMIGLVATPAQLEALQRIQALMSLLEGHGDVTMDRAGADVVPGAARFGRVLRERRKQIRGPAKLLSQILGMEAKLRQYAEGEKFVNEVEALGGPDLFNRVWRGPEWLPSLAEIRNPGDWVTRVGSAPAVAG